MRSGPPSVSGGGSSVGVVEKDGDDVERGSEGPAPLVLRRAVPEAIPHRLPLAAEAVLAGSLDAVQLCVLEEGVQRLVRDGHEPDVAAALERRLVDLASARPG